MTNLNHVKITDIGFGDWAIYKQTINGGYKLVHQSKIEPSVLGATGPWTGSWSGPIAWLDNFDQRFFNQVKANVALYKVNYMSDGDVFLELL